MIPPLQIFSKYKAALFLVIIVILTNNLAAQTNQVNQTNSNVSDTPTVPSQSSYYFLDSNSINTDILSGPPAAGTQAGDEDENTRESAIVAANKKQVNDARKEENDIFSFSSVLGSDFNAKKLPLTAALFQQVGNDSIIAINYAKNVFQRTRPTSDANSDTYSYPSGESTEAFIWGAFLTEIFPHKKKEFIKKAQQKAWYRVILGDHYPSDSYAGRLYGEYLEKEFLKNSNFQQQWAAVKQEITNELVNRKSSTNSTSNSSGDGATNSESSLGADNNNACIPTISSEN